MPNLVFSSLLDPAIAHCINQNELVPSKLLSKHQITSSQIWVLWDKDLANVPLKDVIMERVRVEEFGKLKDEDCGWVNLVFLKGFSLKNLFGSSLHIMGIRVYIVWWVRKVNSLVSNKQGILATRPHDWNDHKFELLANCLARLEVLSYSATAGVAL